MNSKGQHPSVSTVESQHNIYRGHPDETLDSNAASSNTFMDFSDAGSTAPTEKDEGKKSVLSKITDTFKLEREFMVRRFYEEASFDGPNRAVEKLLGVLQSDLNTMSTDLFLELEEE